MLLRPMEPEDVPQLLEWSRDPEVARLAQGDYPDEETTARDWYERIRRDRYRQVFIILLLPDREPIGDIDLNHIAWRSGEAELRVRIGRPFLWGQGLGTQAVRAMLSHAFGTLGLRRVYLRVLRSNPRAIRCYEKCGFRKEGRLRLDHEYGSEELYLMTLRREDWWRAPWAPDGPASLRRATG